MKEGLNNLKKSWKGVLALLTFVFLVLFIFIVIPSLNEPHFKVIDQRGLVVSKNIIRWGDGTNYGNIRIGVKPWEGEWLDENCECQLKECVIRYHKSDLADFGDNSSGTWYGPIEYFEGNVLFYNPGAEVYEKCSECQEYKCGDYKVEVWKQIK